MKLFVLIFSLLQPIFQNTPLNHENLNSGKLQTGWYYVIEKKNNYMRHLDKSNEIYYIDPQPLVSIKHFKLVRMQDDYQGNLQLFIKFDNDGTNAWRVGTGRAIGKKLALIVDDKLVYTPIVNSQVTMGVSALNRGIYSKAELNRFLDILTSEAK